mgnify:CR=1 FL=1
MGCMSLSNSKLLDIFRKKISFEIYGLSNLGFAEVGFGEGVRGDPEDGGLVFEFCDGERNAVNRQ